MSEIKVINFAVPKSLTTPKTEVWLVFEIFTIYYRTKKLETNFSHTASDDDLEKLQFSGFDPVSFEEVDYVLS